MKKRRARGEPEFSVDRVTLEDSKALTAELGSGFKVAPLGPLVRAVAKRGDRDAVEIYVQQTFGDSKAYIAKLCGGVYVGIGTSPKEAIKNAAKTAVKHARSVNSVLELLGVKP